MASVRPSQVSGRIQSSTLVLSTQWSEKTHELVLLQVRWEGSVDASLDSKIRRASAFVEGLKLEQIFQINWRDFFPEFLVPLFPWLLRSSYHKALNPVPPFDKLSGQRAHTLVCRCFGVYQQELQALILKEPSLSLQELSAETLAGMGCTTCLPDVQEFLLRTREHFELTDKELGRKDKQGLWVRPMGMTPAQAVLKLAPLLEQWCEDHQVQAQMVDLCGHQVRLKGELNSDQLKSLQRHWESHLGVRFAATLFL